MKHNTKKGFTLVELLVVIAILAILSTVGVAGYSAFIERANISNDQQMVAQLNNFLIALRADSSSEFYGQDITEYNYMFVADEVFTSSGVGEYTEHAKGYHIVLNYETDSFELVYEGDAVPGYGFRFLTAWAAGDADYSKRPGTNFVQAGKSYGFLHTGKSSLGRVLKTFFTTDETIAEEEYAAHLTEMLGEARKLDALGFSFLDKWMEGSIFVTKYGVFVYDEKTDSFIEMPEQYSEERTIIVHKNAGKVDLNEFKGDIKENATIVIPKDTEVANLGEKLSNKSEDPKVNDKAPEGANIILNETDPQKLQDKVHNGAVRDDVPVTTGSAQDKELVFDNDGGLVDKKEYEEYKEEQQKYEDNKQAWEDYENGVTTEAPAEKLTEAEKPGAVVSLKWLNPIKTFNVGAFHNFATNSIFGDYTDTFIAWEQIQNTEYKVSLVTSNAKGQDENSGVSNNKFRWYVESVDGQPYDSTKHKFTINSYTGEIVFDEDYDLDIGVITVRATAFLTSEGEPITFDVNGKPMSIESIVGLVSRKLNIHVASIRKVDFELGGHGDADGFWTYDEATSTYKVTLVHKDAAGTAYTLKNTITFNNDNPTLNGLTKTITMEADKTGVVTVVNNGQTSTVTTVGAGTTTLTVKIADFKTYKIDVTVVDLIGGLAIKAKNPNMPYVGNGNEIKLSDIFTGDLPANAELRVYDYVPENDSDFMNPSAERALLATNDGGIGAIYVDANQKSITSLDATVKFTNTRKNDTVTLALFSNGVRISPDVQLRVVDGVNVRDYTALSALIDSTAKDKDGVLTYPITNNVVLLDNIAISGTYNYFSIPTGKTLYGNLFKIDATGARNTEGIILVQGTIQDAKVVGSVYGSLALSIGDSNGASVIYANNGAVIDNCYLANTRSPLRVNDGVVTVKDTVLFGGRYANIDIVGGTVKIQGTVTTVQQPIKTADNKTTVIGVGISAWFNDTKKTVVVENGADLIQYNFMNSDLTTHLPSINILGIVDIMDLKDPFNDIMNNYADEYGFVGSDGKVYANSGMVSTDAYMLNYTVTGEPSKSSIISKTYNQGATKTVKITTAVADNDTFEIHYNKSEFKCKTVEDTDGVVTVTGAQLKAGVVFETVKKLTYYGGDATNFSFLVANNNYKTINLSGCQDEYNSLMYTYNDDLRSKLGLVESTSSMHGRGMHYGMIMAEIYTPKNTAGSEYYTRLEEYLTQVVGGKQIYLPDNYTMTYSK